MQASAGGEALAERVAAGFARLFGGAPAGVWSAPGRVNLIGEHTDYNGGCVLPFAIQLRTAAAVRLRTDGTVALASIQHPDEEAGVPVRDLAPGAVHGWAAYPAGLVWAMRDAGWALQRGADILVDGRVPPGGGLSSSAALECSVALALAELTTGESGTDAIQRMQLARLAQRAENEFVGVPTGLMDQAVSMMATEGHALYLDVRSGATDLIPLAPATGGLELLVFDTRTRHDHATGGYRRRRAECAEAARRLGVATLRDVEPAHLEAALQELGESSVLVRRVRHVVTEQARTVEAARLLAAGRPDRLGPLLDASHRSLKNDFEVSTAELDAVVEAARRGGAVGARLTGGGFGGCAIALVPAGSAKAVRAEVAAVAPNGSDVACLLVRPSRGAHRDT